VNLHPLFHKDIKASQAIALIAERFIWSVDESHDQATTFAEGTGSKIKAFNELLNTTHIQTCWRQNGMVYTPRARRIADYLKT